MRPVRIGPSDTIIRHRDDGVIYMDSPFPLAPYATKLTERLERGYHFFLQHEVV